MKHAFTAFLMLCLAGNSMAQITAVRYTIPANSTVYIVMPDTTSETSRAYMAVYRKYWTFSKYSFVSAEDKKKLAKPGNLFFGFNAFKRKDYNQQSHRVELIYMQVFLSLYEYNKREAKKNEPELEHSNIISFKVPVKSLDFYDQLLNADFFYGSDYVLDTVRYDASESLHLWGPGLLKNYIQKVAIQVSKKAPVNESNRDLSPIDNAGALQDLKNATLYVPDYCLVEYKRVGFNKIKMEKKDEAELFEKYKYGHEVISADELNKKILESESDFYYLIYVNDGPRKYINVVNGKTGQIIYAEFSTPSYEFKSGDLKDLMKAIDKE